MSEQKIATLWSRVGGALIDLIIVLVISAVILFVWGFFIGLDGSERYLTERESDALWKGRGIRVGLLIDCIYTVVMMVGDKQATYGQRAVGAKIVKNNGTPIGYGTAIGRWVVSLFSSMFLKIGFLIAIFTRNKKTLHDLVAGTIVVEVGQEEVAKKQHASAEITQNFATQKTSEKFNVPASKSTQGMEDAQQRISPAFAVEESSKIEENSLAKNQVKNPLEVLQIDEDAIWINALNEYESDQRNKGLWTRLYVESNGVEEKAKIAYLKTRASQLLEEVRAQQEAIKDEYIEALEGGRKPLSSFDLGMKIYKGYGDHGPNPAEACKYLYEAAIDGVANAQFNLSLMYWKGDGVRKNKAEAYAWCRIAANSIDDAKDNLKHYSKNISHEEILESDKLVRKYVDLIQS